MCHRACIEFAARALHPEEVTGGDVLEVGSHDVNGSVRSTVEALGPASYVGVDIDPGPGVDVICDAGNLVDRFGEGSFDLVISTELLEHVRDWRRVVSEMKTVSRPGGTLLITTRSQGFGLHGYPFDCWRYEIEDMRRIFGDLEIGSLIRDPVKPGVFLKARKPDAWRPSRLDDVALYSMVRRTRVLDVTDEEICAYEPPFSVRGSLWSLLPAPVRTDGFRSLARRFHGRLTAGRGERART